MNLSTVSKINHHIKIKIDRSCSPSNKKSKILSFVHCIHVSENTKYRFFEILILRNYYFLASIENRFKKIDSKKSISKSSFISTTNDNHHHDQQQQQQQQEPSRQPNLQFSSPKLYCEPIGIFPFWAWTTDERCTMYYDESIKISRSSSSS